MLHGMQIHILKHYIDIISTSLGNNVAFNSKFPGEEVGHSRG
jgi:hypothetical protein